MPRTYLPIGVLMTMSAYFARFSQLGRKLIGITPLERRAPSGELAKLELVSLTHSDIRFREGGRMIVNGLVSISESRNDERPFSHLAPAYVHSYGTSVISNQLYQIIYDTPGIHGVELLLEYDGLPPTYIGDCMPDGITFRYTSGPQAGRGFHFTPVPGDVDGWSEMVRYVKGLIANHAIQRICAPTAESISA